MLQTSRLFGLLLLVASGLSSAQVYVPDDLEGWQQWVLHDKAWRDCPFFFNRNAAAHGDFVCAWPGRLQLDVVPTGARFTQQWTVHAESQWIALPGSAEHWPDQVTANGRSVEVIERDGGPAVRLAPGNWNLTGRFVWDEPPGVLRIPPSSGLLSLTLDGHTVERPEIARDGVFLGEKKTDTRAADAVRVVVYRLVVDDVPTRLVTRLQIDVSGSVREEAFGPVLPEGFVPMSLRSPLPAKLEADGRLHLQVRPGRWAVDVTARAPGTLDAIPAPSAGAGLPDTEVWSYQANDRLRVTAAEGLPPVDPAQVDVPGEWQSFPAFRVMPGETFPIVERSRGVVAPSNELDLERTLWLDFNGAGFIVRDRITGAMRTDWRLDMGLPFALLAATEEGDDLLVTDGVEAGATGVEVRRSDVDLETIGRSETRGEMPATGWDARFASVGARLHLPPGHKLLAAPGVDVARGSWVEDWALLDFFLLLIITIATWRLFGPAAGVVALLALVLGFHERYAPTWLWLNLLGAIALLRVAPPGRLFRIVRGYQLLSAAFLVIALVPFVANEVRTAIYPQLEPQRDRYDLVDAALLMNRAPTDEAVETSGEVPAGARQKLESLPSKVTLRAPEPEEIVVTGSRIGEAFSRYAPNAIVQAGPGIPSWRWNTYELTWNGPVDPEQTMHLVVMPRWLVSALRFVVVGLMLLFAAILAAEVAQRRWTLPGGLTLGRVAANSIGAVAVAAALLAASPPAGAQVPDQELLRQLEQRLLEPPDCVPRCAEIASASVAVDRAAVSIDLSIHALEPVAIPLPGSQQGWRPGAVRVGGGGDARVLRADNGLLWLYVTAGRHDVTLRGPVPETDSLEIPFPTPPRVISARGDGWLVAGIKDRRLLSGSLQLTRLRTDEADAGARWESSRFPAFATVQRRIDIDLDWRVQTTVYRVAPLEGALTLEVPLLDGETIVSGDFTVRDGRVLVSLAPQQYSVSWTSNLPLESPLILRAPQGKSWKETWRVAVGNIWHVDFDGVPESNTGSRADNVRVAEFDPRAGEELVITARRPEASAGSTLAFDAVRLDVVPGNRSRDVSLSLTYRSTRGAQHVIRLPDDSEVTAVTADGRDLTLRAVDNELTLPILPGEHEIEVSWVTPVGIGLYTQTPDVDLGAPAGNIELTFARPADRWLLFTSGPQLGPAVLYWTEMVVMLLFAVILGRLGLSPLTTRHWLFLGLGFSTFSWPALAIVALWLIACGARERYDVAGLDWWRFNAVQVVIAGLTVYALLSIVTALPQGLLGTPDMHVTGYDSHANLLNWFADRSASALPRAAAFTVPMWIYKLVILIWALWLSFALVRWLPWVWKCFSSDGFWRKQERPA